jgi:carboxyl-terminal processing protease
VGSPLELVRDGRLWAQSCRRLTGRALVAGGIGLVLLLGGCNLLDSGQSAAAVARSDAAPSANSMRVVFTEAFTDIQTYYLDPVKIGTLALDGLAGIKQLDDKVVVDRIDAKVRLVVKDTVAKVYDAPEDGDVRGWAKLATTIVGDARDQSAKLKDIDAEQFYRVVLQSALHDLDPFSRYAGHDLAQDNRAGRDGFGGIGVRLSFDGGQVKITDVQSDMPAGRAGLKAGDRIAKIDGRSLDGMAEHAVVSMLRGPVGADLGITYARGPDSKTVHLHRAYIVESTVAYRRQPGRIAYFKITGFNRRTANGLADAWTRARSDMGGSIRGVVLDLRNNPGGLLDQGISVADMFLPGGRILTTKGRHPESVQHFDATGDDMTGGVPMAVLINGGSASASEIVAAALQDLGRAVVVGSGSYGKGTVQTILPLPNQGELTLTWARFFAPSGYAIHRLGVLPTVCTASKEIDPQHELDDLRAGRFDPVKAIAARRGAGALSETAQLALAATCPQVTRAATGDKDVDLNVALRVLRDPDLMQRSIRGMNLAAVSKPL